MYEKRGELRQSTDFLRPVLTSLSCHTLKKLVHIEMTLVAFPRSIMCGRGLHLNTNSSPPFQCLEPNPGEKTLGIHIS